MSEQKVLKEGGRTHIVFNSLLVLHSTLGGLFTLRLLCIFLHEGDLTSSRKGTSKVNAKRENRLDRWYSTVSIGARGNLTAWFIAVASPRPLVSSFSLPTLSLSLDLSLFSGPAEVKARYRVQHRPSPHSSNAFIKFRISVLFKWNAKYVFKCLNV